MGFKDIMFGREAEIKTQTIHDPKKAEVASPMSRFLAEQVGAGVPRYGKQILTDLPEVGGIDEFLKMDADEYFGKYVKDPAMETFEEELLPLIHEDFAGSLSGSGRLRAEGDAARGLARDLAVSRGEFGLKLPAAQMEIAKSIKIENDKEAMAQYSDWLKSLPQYNPVLDKAMKFLQDSTNTGDTVLSYLDEGSDGIFGDIMQAIATAAGAYAAAA